MSDLSTVAGDIETWAITWLTKIANGFEVLVEDVETFWNYIAGHSTQITNGVAAVTAGVQQLAAAGIVVPPVAVSAINELNVAVTTLNAAEAAQNSGANTVGTFVAAYSAAQAAQTAVSNAKGAIVSALPGAVAAPAAGQAQQGSGA